MVTWLKQLMVVNFCRLKGPAVSRPRSRGEKTKGGVAADSPFVHYSRMLNLELISPVQIAVCPASATPASTIMSNPEVSLHGRGQV